MGSLAGEDGSSGIPKPQAGVWGDSQQHYGVVGTSDATGVAGISKDAVGVLGQSGRGKPILAPLRSRGVGVEGESATGVGVLGWAETGTGVVGTSVKGPAVSGSSQDGVGVEGVSKTNSGVHGRSSLPASVVNDSQCSNDGGSGVLGENSQPGGCGVRGRADNLWGFGVRGAADGQSGIGVEGESARGTGVWGCSTSGIGVDGYSSSYAGVWGCSPHSYAVVGETDDGCAVQALGGTTGLGVSGESTVAAVYARNTTSQQSPQAYLATPELAGEFFGDLVVHGALTKSGGGFRIDHPLDPANQYLNHAFVESAEMKTVYDGVVTLDEKGSGVVDLPAWFEALNRDLRYQLTPIGAPAPGLHIAQEVQGNRFRVAGGLPGIKVSWQVTGVRQDAWAQSQNAAVEEQKSGNERGYYLHPQLYNQPLEKGIQFARHADQIRRTRARGELAERARTSSRRRISGVNR